MHWDSVFEKDCDRDKTQVKCLTSTITHVFQTLKICSNCLHLQDEQLM